MAEPVVKNIDEEIKITDTQQQEEEEEEITNQENKEESANSEANNSTDLAGINLVMILSLLSLSDEECRNLDEEESDQLNHKKKKKQSSSAPSTSRSDFVIRKREINEFRAAERQTTKVHAKIRDCRHCRRL